MDYIAEHKKMYNYLIDNFSYKDLDLLNFEDVKEKYLYENDFELKNNCFLCEYACKLREKDKNRCDFCNYCVLSISCVEDNSLYDRINDKFDELWYYFNDHGYCNKEDIYEYLTLLKDMRDLKG